MRSFFWRWGLALLLGSAWGLVTQSKPLAAGAAQAAPCSQHQPAAAR